MLRAQDSIPPAQTKIHLPIIVAAQFQNFSLPLHDLGSHFSHPGILLGSEITLNKKKNLSQQLHLTIYRNKEMGNGIMLCTQTAFRPKIYKNFYGEIKGGAGWMRSWHPVQAWRFEEGEWVETGGGKSQLVIPIGISAEYRIQTRSLVLVPSIGYQILPTLFYNDVLPLSFYSTIQAGARIYLQK